MKVRICVVLSLASLAGCVPSIDYSSLTSAVEARERQAGSRVGPLNKSVRALLGQPLTAESAARIAVLNNRRAQAAFAELGIAEAEVRSARRLPNPTAEAAILYHKDGRPEISLGAMLDITGLILLPLRGNSARSQLDAAKASAVGSILDLSFEARRLFYEYQAAIELVELRRTVVRAMGASKHLAEQLRAAGNITELSLTTEQAAYEDSQIAFQEAGVQALTAREALNAAMGLSGANLGWKAPPRLPALPKVEVRVDRAEQLAIANSIDLAVLKSRFSAAAQRAQYARATGWLPELRGGVAAERGFTSHGDEWSFGPAVELEVPIFYQGQGEVGAAVGQMKQSENLYASTAVQIRATARALAVQLLSARAAVNRYDSVVLPLKQKAVQETQLQYNGMLVGAFQLLQVKRQEVEAASLRTVRLREYWLARTELEQLFAGKLGNRGLNATFPEATDRGQDGATPH